MEQKIVLVVDDEEALRTVLAELLASAGYQVRTAKTGAEALAMLEQGTFDAALLDVLLPDMTGLDVLQRYRHAGGTCPVVVLSALNGADDAVRALKLGATDYLTKPFNRAELEDALGRALGLGPSNAQTRAELLTGRAPLVIAPSGASALEPHEAEHLDERDDGRQLICMSPAMRRIKALVDRIADTDVPVLLLGESGTGKEVISREIHRCSRRRTRPFIKVNCAALPAELLESELFGHERGAFTGATAEKPGKFELADQGTIFLDEIGEMAIRLQAKLLQVLQDEEFFRVGGKRSVRVDSRVVVATNRELEREIELGNFREDLFYRLNVVAIRIAPLRERREDIPSLVDHFLKKYGRRYHHGPVELSPEIQRLFLEYEWPGNVRELENMVRRLVVLKDSSVVMDELRSGGRGLSELRRNHALVNHSIHAGLADDTLPPPPTLGYPHTGGGLSVAQPLDRAGEMTATHAPVVTTQNELTSRSTFRNPFNIPQPPPPPPLVPESEMSLKDIGKRAAMLAEREAILAMLQRTAWNKRKAASKLRISYKALLYKIKESGIIDPRDNAEF